MTLRKQYQQTVLEYVDRGSGLLQVQALLIGAMTTELHGQTHMDGGSNAWNKVGAAIRQAQDLGLHRLERQLWAQEMYADRMRAWIACISADSWYEAFLRVLRVQVRRRLRPTLGHPTARLRGPICPPGNSVHQ